jgi:hypothetical protein
MGGLFRRNAKDAQAAAVKEVASGESSLLGRRRADPHESSAVKSMGTVISRRGTANCVDTSYW